MIIKTEDSLHYDFLMQELEVKLGPQVKEVADLLIHGHTKRAIARILNCPYPDVRDAVARIKEYFSKINEPTYKEYFRILPKKRKARRKHANK